MTTTQFISISKKSKVPQFKELICLVPLPKSSELIDFCTMMHPNCDKISQGNQCQIFTKENHYIYKMYSGCFVRTDVNTGIKKMYLHSIK